MFVLFIQIAPSRRNISFVLVMAPAYALRGREETDGTESASVWRPTDTPRGKIAIHDSGIYGKEAGKVITHPEDARSRFDELCNGANSIMRKISMIGLQRDG